MNNFVNLKKKAIMAVTTDIYSFTAVLNAIMGVKLSNFQFDCKSTYYDCDELIFKSLVGGTPAHPYPTYLCHIGASLEF